MRQKKSLRIVVLWSPTRACQSLEWQILPVPFRFWDACLLGYRNECVDMCWLQFVCIPAWQIDFYGFYKIIPEFKGGPFSRGKIYQPRKDFFKICETSRVEGDSFNRFIHLISGFRVFFWKSKPGMEEGGGSSFFGGGENLENLWEIKMFFWVGESVLFW